MSERRGNADLLRLIQKAQQYDIAHYRLVDYRRRQAVRDHEPLIEALANSDDHPSTQAEARLTRELILTTSFDCIQLVGIRI